MDGILLRVYVDEKQLQHGVPLWEWLLQKANAQGIRGGSAFRAMAGFGRRHLLHEERFFELAGETGIELEFVAEENEVQRLLALIREEKIRVFYARIPVQFGIINPDVADTDSASLAKPVPN